MAERKVEKHKLDFFGRKLTMVLNRASMYTLEHPYVRQAIDDAYEATTSVLEEISPIVFIMAQEKFFVDEEPLDPRFNTGPLVKHFKKKGLQSVSFEKGLERREVQTFIEIYSEPDKYPDAKAIKNALNRKRVRHLKINHVFYKKVTADDEVISKEALRKITPDMMEQDDNGKPKEMLVDALLESILTGEFLRTLDISELIRDPKGFSRQVVKAGIEWANTAQEENEEVTERDQGLGGDGGPTPGSVLLRQLELIGEEIEKNVSKGRGAELEELAGAVFEMKKELIEAVEAQRVVGMAFTNEKRIVEKANEITDGVLVSLVKEEYGRGRTSVARLAQIIRRLVPEPEELKRLLPKIKRALLAEGMSLEDYLELIRELSKELKGEELAKILKESSEEIGLDAEQLIEEVRNNPTRAAELIYMAAEIRKGTGDDTLLSDILVEYIERLGVRLSDDVSAGDTQEGEKHVRSVMKEVQSKILKRLESKHLKESALARLEQTINQKVDEMLDKLRIEWLERQARPIESKAQERLSVLQTLERTVGEDEELRQILRVIRGKAEAEEIDEDDFAQIHREIMNEWNKREAERSGKRLPAGILDEKSLMVFLEKEIAKVIRYDIPFSAAAFTVVKAKLKGPAGPGAITREQIMDTVLNILAQSFRKSDIVGQVGKDKIVALLPMTPLEDAKLALRRVIRKLHSKPIRVNDLPLDLRVAGAVIDVSDREKPDSDSFLKGLFNQLADMATRIRNIHVYL